MDVDIVYQLCGSPVTPYCSVNKNLYYSLLSVKKYMPWYRKIWLCIGDDFDVSLLGKLPLRVEIVRDSDYIPRKYLPIVWNSNVTESWIWKIGGLSEHFVYFCDDMYIGRNISKSDFFVNDLPILRLYEGEPNFSAHTTSPIGYVQMWSNAVQKYGLQYTRIQHQALPYRKSTMAKFYKQFKKQVDDASTNRVRAGPDDFNLLRFTSSLAVMSGVSYLKITNDDYDFFTESDDPKRILKIRKLRPQFFCINNNANNKNVYKMLEKYYANI